MSTCHDGIIRGEYLNRLLEKLLFLPVYARVGDSAEFIPNVPEALMVWTLKAMDS